MSKLRDFDTLYKTKSHRKSWVDGLTPEAVAWLNELADFITERGEEPVWAAVRSRFGEEFPEEQPRSPGTISATVRKIVG